MKIKLPLYLTKDNTIINIASIVSVGEICPQPTARYLEYEPRYNYFCGYSIVTYIKFIGIETSVEISLISNKEINDIMKEYGLTFESKLTEGQHKLIGQKTMEIAQKEFDFIVEKWHEFIVS